MIGPRTCDNDRDRRNGVWGLEGFEVDRGKALRGISFALKGVLGCFRNAGTAVPHVFF